MKLSLFFKELQMEICSHVYFYWNYKTGNGPPTIQEFGPIPYTFQRNTSPASESM